MDGKSELKAAVIQESKNWIAVVGLSCRFPGANSPDEFWEVLSKGEDYVGLPPSGHPCTTRSGSSVSMKGHQEYQVGYLKCSIDEFDAKFFGISPREAIFIDPQQRILLEVTWEALEDAGINPFSLKGSGTAVYVGIWQCDYDNFISKKNLTSSEQHHRFLGNAFSATASRISHFLGLRGCNFAVESGCSSSLAAVHLGCETLRRGGTNLVITSGINLVLNPHDGPFGGRDLAVLSKTGRCKPFSADADGFVRAEGCGVLVLKRFDDAKRDGDYIRAIIRGSAVNNDGAGTSFGTPNAEAQEDVIRCSLKNSHVKPWEVTYLEAHGTGTVVGDPTEMYAVRKVYSESRTKPLIIGSVKSNIGHTESCAGIAGLIKIILSFENNLIPPTLHFSALNPKIDLDSIPSKILIVLDGWSNNEKIAGISSFSMSGTNVHMLLQEHVRENIPHFSGGKNNEKLQLITISAKSEEALEQLVSRHVNFIKVNLDIPLEKIAFGLNACRAHFGRRISIIAASTRQLIQTLQERKSVQTNVNPKVAFLFTGQGSQYVGMAQTLHEEFPVFKGAMEDCNVLFTAEFGYSLLDVISDEPLLKNPLYCQPTIFCIQYSLLQLWSSFGVVPHAVLGHSVGEYAAAVAAGIFNFENAFRLVVTRSRLIETVGEGRMLAVMASLTAVKLAIEKFKTKENAVDCWIDIAAVNSVDEVVVAGKIDAVIQFQKFCNSMKMKSVLLESTHAYHSRAMDSIIEEYGKFLSKVQTCAPTKTIYISSSLGKCMKTLDFAQGYWEKHLRDTVNFQSAVNELWQKEFRCFIEIGPQPILCGLTTQNIRTDSNIATFCPSIRKSEDNRRTIFTSLGKLYEFGIDIIWSEWFRRNWKEIVHRLPKYPFQRQKFWSTKNSDAADLNYSIQMTGDLMSPLLGRPIPSPLSHLTTFINTLDVTGSPLEYLCEHKVAEQIIFPAAGFLEIMLTAASAVLLGDGLKLPFVVENFNVLSALHLDNPKNIQTIATQSHSAESICCSATIYSQNDSREWKQHATGNLNIASGAIGAPDSKNLRDALSKMESSSSDLISEFYGSIGNIGIQFGNKFQSIVGVWYGTTGDVTEMFTKFILPADIDGYICHPIVLDAMIQSYAFKEALLNPTRQQLKLPVCIRKFIWCAEQATEILFAYTSWLTHSSGNTGTVNLFNERGQLLAIMEGIELVETTVESFLRVLQSEEEGIPSFWHETWIKKQGIMEGRVLMGPNDTLHFSEDLGPNTKVHQSDHGDTSNRD